MRILVYEFASGGGLAGRPVPKSLAREGRAMLSALVADLARIGRHEIVTTADRRFTLHAPRGVDVVTIGRGGAALLDDLIASVDAVWLIAPETDGWLEGLAAKVERTGRMLLGTGSAAIRCASDKAALARTCARSGLLYPETRTLRCVGADPRVRPGADTRVGPYDLVKHAADVARDLGYPIVLKPRRGAGCDGVCLARNERELRRALQVVGRTSATEPIVVQPYVHGTAASVSLLSDGRRAVALAANAQAIRAGSTLSYAGGRTPLDHPLAERAIDAAIRTCEAFPGLHGYVGVDLVLTSADAVVIEVNPRLTTAYLGVRSAINRRSGSGNIAEMAIDACAGRLPTPPRICRRVQFTSSGRITSTPLVLSSSKDEPSSSWFDRLTTSGDRA